MMCRWVVAIGLVGLFFSCSSRKHVAAHYREESYKTVEATFRDTLRQRHVEQEREQTFWDIEMVREWVDTADSLSPRTACPDKAVERWRIRAVSSKEVQRVDSLEEVKNSESFLSDTCTVAGYVDKTDERRTGRNVSWVLYLMLVVLGIVSIGLIVKC